ncbi:hypothetical protein DP113_24570 [Brasilonema octagenarum UFV-E1]|uniref:TIR domain-containing protein n=1 Tax=Brasilonema sennae CENA114 TaxID=415709 RepID=A0A856MKL6_9CYAN|nr:hypothetical protein [Brasilonema sennae]QDL10664.1 hypothetical protein DP114_24655 [Brasilonema sennae CENA114]QDL17011.1 hypothetical protein DP113_24570 [Brasilonema octagenarum UFV-E1]
MGFEDDIFISYAHIDNQPLTEGQEGWISDFHRALEIRLAQLRGEKPKIWRDLKLQGNDYFGDTIVERFPKVVLLLSVLSPRYVKSKWCIKELQKFCEAAAMTGGVRLAEKSRIFKVIKTPIARNEHPPEVQELLGYEFYQLDQSGRPIEYSKIFGVEAERNYWTKINDLAYDIKQMLDSFSSHDHNGAVEQNPVASTGTTIYLAETTFDLIEERNKVKRELQQRGYVVLPEQSLSPYYPDFEQVVCENLQRSKLSIHLIGAKYGMVPEGADKSVVVLQNELAVKHSQKSPEFLRLVWMPVGLQPQEPRQEELIQSLQSEPNLLQTSLEELKTIIKDKLNSKPQPPKEVIAEDGPLRVYLICDQRDLEAIAPLDDYLYNQGFEVILPLFEGDEAQVRQDHQEQLQMCDAVIIYCGNIQELWLRTKLGDLRKIYGYGRSKPMLAKGIYMGEPHTPQKQRWCRSREAQLITNVNELELFVAQLIQGGQR